MLKHVFRRRFLYLHQLRSDFSLWETSVLQRFTTIGHVIQKLLSLLEHGLFLQDRIQLDNAPFVVHLDGFETFGGLERLFFRFMNCCWRKSRLRSELLLLLGFRKRGRGAIAAITDQKCLWQIRRANGISRVALGHYMALLIWSLLMVWADCLSVGYE